MRMGPSRFGQRLAARPVAAGLLRTAARQITRYPVNPPRPGIADGGPAAHAPRPTTYRSGKSELPSPKNTHCHIGVFRCSEAAGASIEVAGCQFVADLGRP